MTATVNPPTISPQDKVWGELREARADNERLRAALLCAPHPDELTKPAYWDWYKNKCRRALEPKP